MLVQPAARIHGPGHRAIVMQSGTAMAFCGLGERVKTGLGEDCPLTYVS